MPFEKGHKKATGRPKGSLNKSSETIRLAFAQLLEDNLGQLKEDIDSLDPKDRAKFFVDLSKYIVPTLKATEINLGNNSDLIPTITFTNADKSK